MSWRLIWVCPEQGCPGYLCLTPDEVARADRERRLDCPCGPSGARDQHAAPALDLCGMVERAIAGHEPLKFMAACGLAEIGCRIVLPGPRLVPNDDTAAAAITQAQSSRDHWYNRPAQEAIDIHREALGELRSCGYGTHGGSPDRPGGRWR